MDWTVSLAAAAVAFMALLGAGYMQARRGIGRLSILPWDYLMILAALALLGLLAHLAILWRDDWPV